MEYLVAICAGSFQHISVSSDELNWLYADNRDDASLKYYMLDRRSRHHALLFDLRPALKQYQLVPTTSHVIQTSDGEDMVVYVSLPLEIKPKKLPFVVNVHGGPWYHDSWGLDAETSSSQTAVTAASPSTSAAPQDSASAGVTWATSSGRQDAGRHRGRRPVSHQAGTGR